MRFNRHTVYLINGVNLIRRLHHYLHQIKLRVAEGGVQGVSPWVCVYQSQLHYLIWHLRRLPRSKRLLKMHHHLPYLRLHYHPFRLSIGSQSSGLRIDYRRNV